MNIFVRTNVYIVRIYGLYRVKTKVIPGLKN